MSKYIKSENVCQFLGPHNVGKRTFFENTLHMTFEIFSHMRFRLPGPLRTAFELKDFQNLRRKVSPMWLH